MERPPRRRSGFCPLCTFCPAPSVAGGDAGSDTPAHVCQPANFGPRGRLRSVDGAADSGEPAGFRIIRPLGAGGMGEVYSVEHPRLPRRSPQGPLRRSYPRIRVSGSGSPAKPISPPNSGTRTSWKSVTAATTTVNCGFRWPTPTARTPPDCWPRNTPRRNAGRASHPDRRSGRLSSGLRPRTRHPAP